MFFSLFFILLVGYLLGSLLKKIGFPALLGMLLAGMLIGPYGANLLDPQMLELSSTLRTLALVVILIRAGLNLEIEDLKRAGRPAIMLCFVPALFEMLGTVIFAPILLGLSLIDSLLLASVLAAVSPAVIVPGMLKVMEEGYGKEKAIPQMILTGASADDILVIALFGIFSQIATSGTFDAMTFLRLPISVILGVACGVLFAYLMNYTFRHFHLSTAHELLILLCACFLLEAMEQSLNSIIGFSGLLGIMAMGIVLSLKNKKTATSLSGKLGFIWEFAQIFLFVLVGSALNLPAAFQAGISAILLIPIVLLFRSFGVLVCVYKTKLNKKERLFTVFSYLPKATVQAAIGAVPLSLGVASGNLILTIAVASILITAPIGAFLIDLTYKKFLEKNS